MHRPFLSLGFLLGGLAVGAGAFGAHGLEGRLEPSALAIFDTAVHYQMLGGVALVLVGLAAARWPITAWSGPGLLLAAGVLVFSGTLYVLALTGIGWLGAITPIGGVLLIAGFLWAGWIAAMRT